MRSDFRADEYQQVHQTTPTHRLRLASSSDPTPRGHSAPRFPVRHASFRDATFALVRALVEAHEPLAMSASVALLGAPHRGLVVARPEVATRQRVSRGPRPVRAAATSDAAPTPSRREALAAAFSAAAAASLTLRPLPAFAASVAPVAFDPVQTERWTAVPISTALPSDWNPRPGQRAKQSKFMLYTDTYGPNYRYTTALPRYVDADGAVAAQVIQVAVQSRGGQESIADLGPIAGIDAAKAFGIEAEDIALAEVVTASKRTDAGKQTYYQWELLCPTGNRVLISACISGGGLYVFSAEANADQWGKHADALRGAATAFAVPVVSESTTDISNRIYNNASEGGFK